jgi:hypothetical protein
MAKAMGTGSKTTFGKRKDGKPFKRKSPMDKNVKPTRGQG